MSNGDTKGKWREIEYFSNIRKWEENDFAMKCQTSVPGGDVIWSLQAQGSGGVCGYFKQILIHFNLITYSRIPLWQCQGIETGVRELPGVYIFVVLQGALCVFIHPSFYPSTHPAHPFIRRVNVKAWGLEKQKTVLPAPTPRISWSLGETDQWTESYSMGPHSGSNTWCSLEVCELNAWLIERVVLGSTRKEWTSSWVLKNE